LNEILDIFRFSIIKFFDLKIGPKNLPIRNPKFDETLYPKILNNMKKKYTKINSIK